MIQVRDIAYVRYQAPNLDAMESFLTDFGLRPAGRSANRLYMRGHASPTYAHITEQAEASRGIGIGLFAQSYADLEKVAAEFGTAVRTNDEPCGGQIVTLEDPAGFRVDLLHGFTPLAALPTRQPVAFNPASGRLRRGSAVRLEPAASHVMRLGHVILKTPDIQASLEFYSQVLGFRISDSYHADDPGQTVAIFMHCGLGAEYVDHHTIALLAAEPPAAGFDHSAFEVLDWDDLMLGNAHLTGQGRTHSWGVGRHVQGSQIFDYWRDPFGNKIEHWTDGDLVNESYRASHEPLSAAGLAQWAPPLNPEFFS